MAYTAFPSILPLMVDGHHSDWHRIWVAAMAARSKYASRSLSQRMAFGAVLGVKDTMASEAKSYAIYNWNRAAKNGQTCAECGQRPTVLKGKPLF